MHVVDELFNDVECATRVWVSESAQKDLKKWGKKSQRDRDRFLAKLKAVAIAGFELHEGNQVRDEEKGVFRFGIQDSLFRMYGFYEQDQNDSVVFIATMMKRGTDRGRQGDAIVEEVARIRDKRLWQRSEYEGYPRPAQYD